MEITTRTHARWILPAALMVAAVLGFLVVHPTGGAIPASAVVGTVTYTDVNGSSDLTTTIRSFSMEATASFSSGGSGGGTGKATFGAPSVVQEVVAGSPWIMSALASGRHLPTVVVTLYRAKTTKTAQVWTFYDAMLTLDDQTQRGPASRTPAETVSWGYDKIRQSTYASNGTTVVTTSCFDLAQSKAC